MQTLRKWKHVYIYIYIYIFLWGLQSCVKVHFQAWQLWTMTYRRASFCERGVIAHKWRYYYVYYIALCYFTTIVMISALHPVVILRRIEDMTLSRADAVIWTNIWHHNNNLYHTASDTACCFRRDGHTFFSNHLTWFYASIEKEEHWFAKWWY
jgi:hypothetical protein